MKNRNNIFLINKVISMFLLLTVLCFFAGCGNKGSNAENKLSSASMPDFQYMFKELGAQTPTQKSDSGYYNVISDKIIYTDAKTLKSTPLCNKTDCLHTSNFPDCNANLADWYLSFDNFQIYNDNIYYLATAFDEIIKESEIHFNSISLDGSKKDTVLILKNELVTDWFLYNGYFYYQTTVNIGEDESNTMSGNYYRIDLSSQSEEVFIDFSKLDGIFGAEGSLRNVYDNYMYVTLSGYSSEDAYNKVINGEEIDGDALMLRKIARYSLADGSYIIIDPYNNDYEFIGFSDGKLIGTDSDGDTKKICISELDGTNPQTITEVNNLYQVFCDDNYIYVYNQSGAEDNDERKTITVYDKNSKKISDAYLPDEVANNMSLMTFYDDYMWFENSSASGNVYLCVIDKSQLLNNEQEITYQEVYKYE